MTLVVANYTSFGRQLYVDKVANYTSFGRQLYVGSYLPLALAQAFLT